MINTEACFLLNILCIVVQTGIRGFLQYFLQLFFLQSLFLLVTLCIICFVLIRLHELIFKAYKSRWGTLFTFQTKVENVTSISLHLEPCNSLVTVKGFGFYSYMI